MVAASELPINESATALEMANEIFGVGASVQSATFLGWSESSGIYSGGDSIAPGVTPADTGVILSTGRASDITRSTGDSNQATNTSTNTPGVDNDPQLNALAGSATFDAAILEIDFIPTTDTYSLLFVYSSEEYPEFVNSIYNDLVGVWVNDTAVELAVGTGNSDIGNINAGNNVNLFQDNGADPFNTEMDGFTVTLTLTLNVNPGELNSLRIGVADVADSNFDTSLLIAGDSVQNAVLLSDDSFDVVQNGTPLLDVLSNDAEQSGGVLTITQINGVDVVAGDTVTLATGQQVTLNADGTFALINDDDLDSINFTYSAENAAGITDTAFVTINTIPCFVAGTRIATPDGTVPIEQVQTGDLVLTHDDGPQPVRWVGRRVVLAAGNLVPIRIEAGAMGDHGTLRVSPQHRILVNDSHAELYFAEAEVLVAAKDLVNGETIIFDRSMRHVEYVHILFDSHQVIYSDGLPSESFLPGPVTFSGFERPIIDEICTIFPELDPKTGEGYGPAARRSLKGYEAQLLFSKAGQARRFAA